MEIDLEMPKYPARVHVILAREADYGIVIRRGPTKSVCVIGWNRKTDEFKIGQWLRGRIDEQNSDLSPDGKHFLYFASRGRKKGEVEATWTGIINTGGGLFITNSDYYLCCHTSLYRELHYPDNLNQLQDHLFKYKIDGKCPNIYHIRLLRDGWNFKSHVEDDSIDRFYQYCRPLPLGWMLEKTIHSTWNLPEGKGSCYETHQLTHPGKKVALDFPDWEWADVDRDRLAWVERGILRVATVMKDGPDFIKTLHDFNNMTFKGIQAPY